MTADELREFEAGIAEDFNARRIRAPIHLSGGNEEELIKLFEKISPEDWVFSTYRNHYHALLHGVPEDWLRAEILAGRSMTFSDPKHRFFSSAIVGGCLGIAVGVAEAIKRKDSGLCPANMVWVFVGDMASRMGVFHETVSYSKGHGLPIEFIIEDNGFSTDTPTSEAWGTGKSEIVSSYKYSRVWPHVNTGRWIDF